MYHLKQVILLADKMTGCHFRRINPKRRFESIIHFNLVSKWGVRLLGTDWPAFLSGLGYHRVALSMLYHVFSHRDFLAFDVSHWALYGMRSYRNTMSSSAYRILIVSIIRQCLVTNCQERAKIALKSVEL